MEVDIKCGWIPAVRELEGQIQEAVGGEVTSDSIVDATGVGKSILTADTAAAARTAIGAGTSNLTIGTTASTAKAGNYVPSTNEVAASLKAKAEITALTEIADTAEATAEDVATAVNAIIAALKA